MSGNLENAVNRVAERFQRHGWTVEVEPRQAGVDPDLLISKGAAIYVVEIKSLRESRTDRAIPLLSQAILQAVRYGQTLKAKPMAVLIAPRISESMVEKAIAFAQAFAPGVAIGLVAENQGAHFIGDGLQAMNEQFAHESSNPSHHSIRSATDLFSDLNQWMLKVLLAPDLPAELLTAPRRDYRTVQQLAVAADVSAMSASRFCRRLKEEGFLEISGRSLRVVRRWELFQRWKSAASRSTPEMRMSYLMPGSTQKQLQRAASKLDGCVAMFAAADLLHVGHVSGVPPYLYVAKLHPRSEPGTPVLHPIEPGEQPQIIIRQAATPEAVFRAAVTAQGVRTTDVIQIYLDTAAHPSRGLEQAALLERTVLKNVLGDAE